VLVLIGTLALLGHAPPPLADLEAALEAEERGDFAGAFDLLAEAAEQGEIRAQTRLAEFYRKGLGVRRSYVEAARWYAKAADQGDGAAQYNLGVHYRQGLGVVRSARRACDLFRRAAVQGFVLAQINLALCYAKGNGVPRDDVTAYAWLHRAAEGGHEIAVSRRDALAERLTREQIAEGERMSWTLY